MRKSALLTQQHEHRCHVHGTSGEWLCSTGCTKSIESISYARTTPSEYTHDGWITLFYKNVYSDLKTLGVRTPTVLYLRFVGSVIKEKGLITFNSGKHTQTLFKLMELYEGRASEAKVCVVLHIRVLHSRCIQHGDVAYLNVDVQVFTSYFNFGGDCNNATSFAGCVTATHATCAARQTPH